MISSDETIFVRENVFNVRMDSVEKRFDGFEKRFDNLEALIGTEIRINGIAHEHLQTSIYWGFAVIAIVIALVGFMIALAPSFLEHLRLSRKNELTEDRIQSMIDTSISKALANLGR